MKEDPAEAVVISKKDMKALDRESRKKLKGRFAEGSTLFVCKSGAKNEAMEAASKCTTQAEAPEERLEAGLYFTLEAEFWERPRPARWRSRVQAVEW